MKIDEDSTIKECLSALAELIENSTYFAWAGEDCRECNSFGHNSDCSYQKAVDRAESILKKHEWVETAHGWKSKEI